MFEIIGFSYQQPAIATIVTKIFAAINDVLGTQGNQFLRCLENLAL